MRKKMRFSFFLTLLLLAAGIMVLLYPFVSSWLDQRDQAQIIDHYEEAVDGLTKEEITAEKKASQAYNEGLLGNVVLTDPFDAEAGRKASEGYEERLNLNGDGIMGYIEIPEIDVRLPIYHGTGSEVLDKGVGHLENTSLPVGGTAAHCVLSAHTAYAKATLFNRLTELAEGDVFYLTVLDETLAYEVDQIKVVEPTDTGDLVISGHEDYVTLVTCTPYGVNSHRLLVRGTRIPYEEEEAAAAREQAEQTGPIDKIAAAALLVLLGIFLTVKRRRRRRKETGDVT